MPTPASPVVVGLEAHEITYAKDQPEYIPLPAVRSADGKIVTRWTLTDAERAAIANGADIFLFVWTHNNPLQPVALDIDYHHLPSAKVWISDFIGLPREDSSSPSQPTS